MRFRRRRPPSASKELRPGRTVLIVDLHVDFIRKGPLAAEGSDPVAIKLADLVREQEAAFLRWREAPAATRNVADATPATSADDGESNSLPDWGFRVLVEGGQWGKRAPLPQDSPFPPHCEGWAASSLAWDLTVVPHHYCHVWENCPACGGDVLAAMADGKGQLFSLERSLASAPRARIDIAGLSAEHSALALAEAVAIRFGPAGIQTAFWPDLSTFLYPDRVSARLGRLEQLGVTIKAGDEIRTG